MRICKKGYVKFYVVKESGRLYVKDSTGDSRAIEFALYCDEHEHLGLRDYMNITSKSHIESLELLIQSGAVLVGPRFDICFYDESSVDKFLDLTEIEK